MHTHNLALSLSLSLTHTLTHTQAWQGVVPDMVAYQQVWRRIMEDAQDVEELKLLELLVASIKV